MTRPTPDSLFTFALDAIRRVTAETKEAAVEIERYLAQLRRRG